MRSFTRRLRTARTMLAFGAVMMLAGGCASTTRIGTLLAEPQRYDGETVQVTGTVTRGAGVLGIGAYEVDDGTGRIVVIARGQGVPSDGSRTKAKGTFHSVFSWAGRTIAAIVQGDNGSSP